MESCLGITRRLVDKVWGGIRALIQARVENGSFGAKFPENCPDGPIVIGTDAAALRDAMRAHVPGLSIWPWRSTAETPSTLDILDIIEFCWMNVAEPSRIDPHPGGYYQHNHLLEFDVNAGKELFRAEIEDYLQAQWDCLSAYRRGSYRAPGRSGAT